MAADSKIYDHAARAMGGNDHDADDKPKKEIEHIRTRKVKNSKGGHSYVHEHHHTHPEHYPKEEFASDNQDAMVGHMLDHMGDPNPGEAQAEAQADAGQAMAGAVPQAQAPVAGA